MLPHADLVVCLDGRGGIAAVCAPSELSAALKQSVNDSPSISVSSSSGTDSEVTCSTTVLTDRHTKNGQSHQNSNTNTKSDVAGDGKKLTRNESSGFFDLLSALPGMRGDAAPAPSSLSSSPSSSLSSNMQADDSSSASLSDTDVSDVLNIFGDNTDFRNKNKDSLANKEMEKVKEKEKNKERDRDVENIITLNTNEQKMTTFKNTDSMNSEEGVEDNVQHTAALLVEKETKSEGTIGIDVYWFYVKSGGGLVAVLLVAISNIFLPSAW